MEKERPIQRRDFLKSATAASVLAGTAALAAGAGETPKVSEDKSKDQGRVAAAPPGGAGSGRLPRRPSPRNGPRSRRLCVPVDDQTTAHQGQGPL